MLLWPYLRAGLWLWGSMLALLLSVITISKTSSAPQVRLQASTTRTVYTIDTRTGVAFRDPQIPEESTLDSGEYVISFYGSIDAVMFRVIHASSREETLLGPYAIPARSLPPYFEANDRLWLVTLSADREKTILYSLESDEDLGIIGEIVVDFATEHTLVSADHTWILLVGKTTNNSREMIALNMLEGTPHSIPNRSAGAYSWSPHNWLFTMPDPEYEDEERLDLQWFHPQSGALFQLIEEATYKQLTWSPSGRYAVIELIIAEPALNRVILVDLEEQVSQMVLESPDTLWMQWSQDESRILIEADSALGTKLFAIDRDTYTTRFLGNLPEDGQLFYELAPNGRFAVYDRKEGDRTILTLIDLNTAKHHRVLFINRAIQQIQWIEP